MSNIYIETFIGNYEFENCLLKLYFFLLMDHPIDIFYSLLRLRYVSLINLK